VGTLIDRAKAVLGRAQKRYPPLDVAIRVVKRYSEDDAGTYAAALTYYTFFSLFPILFGGAAILGYLTLGNETLRHDIIQAGVDAFPLIKDVLKPDGLSFIEGHRQSLALTGIALALYSGSGAIVALEHAINKVHRVTSEGNFFQKRLRSLVWLVALGAAAIATLAMGSIATFTEGLFPQGPALAKVLGFAGGLAVNFLIFIATFRFLPAHPRPIRQTIPGAIFAAVGFEVLKLFGSQYLQMGANTREATFGTLATAAGLLVASYLLAQIVLYAAELNAVMVERAEQTRERNDTQSATIDMKGGAVTDPTEKTSSFSGNGHSGEKSAGQLMKEVTEDLSTLIRKEIELAKQEIGSSVSTKIKGGVIIAIAGTLAFFALIFMLLTVRDTLDDLIGVPGDWVWLADIITAFLLLAIGGLGALVAKKKLTAPISAEMTKKTIKEDVEWAKTLTKR
jgi:inner membrane protein YhjD